jgi:hypothetical protein
VRRIAKPSRFSFGVAEDYFIERLGSNGRLLRSTLSKWSSMPTFAPRSNRPSAARQRMVTTLIQAGSHNSEGAQMITPLKCGARRPTALLAAAGMSLFLAGISAASDHLDSPVAVNNPAADIADMYAWTSPDGRQLNLIMTIQGHAFSDKLDYTFHIDSGKSFSHTTASTSILCRFPAATAINCTVGKADSAAGDPRNPQGLEGRNHGFRVYAALRDDPFFNNIKGLVGSYQLAGAAIQKGAKLDAAGCPNFDEATVAAIADQMRHTEGGTAQNFLGNWTVSAIVISVDLPLVDKGGRLLAIWGTTSLGGKPLNRMAQPFVKNTLLGASPFATDDASGRVRDRFNVATPSTSGQFVADLEKSLAFQDSLDGKCGNQILANPKAATPLRYQQLAAFLANDRLWVNAASTRCAQFFAVELSHLAGRKDLLQDCGGRTPNYNTSNVFRSLIIAGTTDTTSDGLERDEHVPSSTEFPFLAPPDAKGIDH